MLTSLIPVDVPIVTSKLPKAHIITIYQREGAGECPITHGSDYWSDCKGSDKGKTRLLLKSFFLLMYL